MLVSSWISLLATALPAYACDSCYGPQNDVVQTRHVRRMQPGAESAVSLPRAPLDWGQLNFMHTTDTHGWLEGHLKEQNYGADWGDYVDFVRHQRLTAFTHGVDLLVVDTGDLHDGNGLSDASSPNGALSNPIFENIGYDLLTIGNHELYVTEIAYETFNNFSKVYGDRYLTSNVEIMNPSTGQFEYIGSQYRYFNTTFGLRVMSFGVLYDFTGNSNVSRVTKAAALVKQQWFIDAVNFDQPIDLFVILGHNPPRPTSSSSTFGTIYNAVRSMRPDIPIQIFGGHTHVRDFVVYNDGKGSGLESGRYCETLGWLSMAGIESTNYKGKQLPANLPHPTRKLMASGNSTSGSNTTSNLLVSRRYLDWNRLTFEYHVNETASKIPFDLPKGKQVTSDITSDRTQLDLEKLYGCAPQTWCLSCAPFGTPTNIFSLLETALSTVVVNKTRATTPRLIIINTGSARFDLPEGPFTYDDSFIVSPFTDAFEYLQNVPYSQAKQVLGILNAGAYQKRDLSVNDFGFSPLTDLSGDSCVDPPVTHDHVQKRAYVGGKVIRQTEITPGYTTTDDFGTDGDDTIHSKIPYYNQPNDLQANGSFPTDGSMPATVDLIFLDFITPNVLAALSSIGSSYTTNDVTYYLPMNFTTNSYLPAYAQVAPDWQKNVPNCPLGTGV